MAPEDLKEKIAENASGPAEGADDGGSFKEHKPTEQIAADRYLKSTEAAGGQKLRIRFAKFRPAGPGSY